MGIFGNTVHAQELAIRAWNLSFIGSLGGGDRVLTLSASIARGIWCVVRCLTSYPVVKRPVSGVCVKAKDRRLPRPGKIEFKLETSSRNVFGR
jgi:hypothetical protein